MRGFKLDERPVGWVDAAPIRIEHQVDLSVTPERAFATLADHEGWTAWFGGMRRVRVDGAASGVGALRTVWVGATRVQERFIVWEPAERMMFNIVECNLPGLRAMVEDWRLEPLGEDRARLFVTIGLEPVRLLRPLSGVARAIVARLIRGASGVAGAPG